MKYLVLLIHNRTSEPRPLMRENENPNSPFDRIALFDTYAEADDAGESSPMGQAAGYEVVEWSHL